MISPVAFAGRVLVLGCGSVAQCTLPLLVKHLDMPADRITIMDFADRRNRVSELLAQGVRYVQQQVTEQNMGQVLGEHLSTGDVLVDLAWNIDCVEILQWCHDNGVLYLNTSVEVWDPYADHASLDPRDRSLYVRHMDVRRRARTWDRPGATAVLEHGANPGLVSHFTKRALLSIAERLLAEPPTGHGCDLDAVRQARDTTNFPALAMHLGVRVIHIAERDTQIANRPKEVDEFVNTWSVDGLYEEGLAPAELGWGTHERRLPADAFMHQDGPCNQLALGRMGLDTQVRSWTPGGEIIGWVVRHGEAFTISDHLTVWDGERAAYRPTVHYAYCPSDAAIASIHELKARHLQMQSRQRIMNDEIISGSDFMGVLLMGHPFKSWWTGSCLDIDTARSLVPSQSATTVQVGSSITAAVRWMIQNPDRGVCVPDDLPWNDILRDAMPYLGTFHDGPVDWTPLQNRAEQELFGRFTSPRWQTTTPGEEWQFTSFLVG
jgi:homospermidine synthase